MSAWQKTKRYSKKGFDKAWDTVDKLGGPVNRLSNKLGAEAFWPMSIDKESDKAARILRSFCKDGFYAPESEEYTDENGKINRPKGKQRVIKKIPSKVIKNAKGLAIFTTMRTGLWISGSGGSGVLLARIPETGEWSPPSGIMLHTAGIGFLAGVDIYDCVVVINTYEALEAFKKVRCTLGGEVSAAAGPVGMGGVLDSEVHKRQSPIWTYMKSKGLYAGVAVDGTIIIERTDENEKFYGERISVTDILAGKARHPPDSIKTLLQTIKAAQGDVDVDESLVAPSGETPGDLDVTANDHLFGVPDADDPDPYGVKALEAEGMFIREAGSKVRPSHEAFEFRPNPGSPVYATFSRRSLDSSPRNSWRASVQSYTSVDRGTQTEDASLTAPTSVSRASSLSAKESTNGPSANPWEEDEKAGWDTVPIHGGEEKEKEVEKETTDARANGHAETEKIQTTESDDEFEVHEVSNATITRPESPNEEVLDAGDSRRMSPTFTRARLVTINKRSTPPPLPPRHPRHTWGSGSSRESTSPTALSHTSRSTEETEPAPEATEPSALPSNVKKLQTSIVAPAVVDEDGFDESDSELRADKDEFLSATSDNEDDNEHHTVAEGLAALNHEGIKADKAETKPEESVSETEAPKIEPKTEKKEVEGAEDVLSQLEEKFPSPEVESPAKKVDVQKTSSTDAFAPLRVDEESDDTIESPADQKTHTSDVSPKTQA
ncbi:SH3 domain-containing YSC84-like protein 1 [Penicillium rolfsii]|nr:SH3 domain-containing YSC84-like protein 1 [Penicillium rolfsii]